MPNQMKTDSLEEAIDDNEVRYLSLCARFDNVEFRLSIIESMLVEIRCKLEEMAD